MRTRARPFWWIDGNCLGALGILGQPAAPYLRSTWCASTRPGNFEKPSDPLSRFLEAGRFGELGAELGCGIPRGRLLGDANFGETGAD
jgi:hypothetical protein